MNKEFETHTFKRNIFCKQTTLFKFMEFFKNEFFSVDRFTVKMGARVGKEIVLFLEIYFSLMNIIEA